MDAQRHRRASSEAEEQHTGGCAFGPGGGTRVGIYINASTAVTNAVGSDLARRSFERSESIRKIDPDDAAAVDCIPRATLRMIRIRSIPDRISKINRR